MGVSVLPNAAQWEEPARRTFAELLADVHQAANALYRLGVRRSDAVALLSPNCVELITATLDAPLSGAPALVVATTALATSPPASRPLCSAA